MQRGTARPYYWKAKGLRPEGVFVRQDAASVPASEAAIREMLLASADGAFERMRSLRQDLTFGAAAAFFRERKVAFGPAQRRSLGLVGEDGLFTNLALLLSDQCPFTLKLAVFEGTGKTVFRERREIGGSVLAQVREAFDYLDKWNRTRAEVRGLDRVDRRDYPPEAVREALLNAVVHRDYALPGADLVSLFDDRLEVLSAGGLVRGVSLSDVLLGLSALRNAALAGVFYRLGFPDLEVEQSFNTQLLTYYSGFRDTEMSAVLTRLLTSAREDRIDDFMKTLQSYFASIPYDIRGGDERYYQTIFFITFLLIGISIEAESKTNEGRIDAYIRTQRNVYLFELKLDRTADKAVAQIADNHYYEKFQSCGLPVVMVGVNFDSEKGRIDGWKRTTLP